VKHLILALTLGGAMIAAACGGSSGSSTPPPPPPKLGFSNASLSGQYAFEMSGEDLNGQLIARVGSFSANGSGSITAAVEDVNDGGSFSTVQFSGGTYSIGSDGRGTLTLTGGSLGGGLGLNIALSSPNSGVAVQTDGNAASSGSFDLQTASAFSLTAISGHYAFDLSGQDSTGAPLSIVGEFAANATGGLTGGTIDVNDGSQAGPSGPNPIPSNSTAFSMDPTFGTSDGRGMASINGQTLAFYMVDGTRLRFVEEDATAITVGDAFVQTGTIPTQVANLSGNFAFISAGAAVLGNLGAIARAGSAMFNGGTLSNAFLDDNNAGNHTARGPDSGTYTIDSAGSGRGTFTFTDSSAGTFSYIFYLFSPTQAVLLETSNGLIGAGSLSAQPSSVSTSALAGNYVFNWGGLTIPSSGNIGFEEDFIGEYALSSSGSIGGNADFAEPGSTSNRGPIFTDVPLTGTFNAGSTGRNAYKVTVSPGNGAPSTTIDFAAYVAAGNTIYVVTTDSTRVTAGAIAPQTGP
jgi:hypothetical protein